MYTTAIPVGIRSWYVHMRVSGDKKSLIYEKFCEHSKRMITNRNSSLILLTGGHRTTNFRNCYYFLIDSIWMFLRLSLNMSFSQYCLFQQYISKLRQVVAMLIFCTWESNVVHLFRSLLIHKPLFSYDNLEEFLSHTAQKMKFSMKDFFSKCDKIRSFVWIGSHLQKKFFMENFIFLCSARVCWFFQIWGNMFTSLQC